jgi:hypothetical protein
MYHLLSVSTCYLTCTCRRKAFTDYIKTHNCSCKVDNPAPVSKPAAAASSTSSSSSNTAVKASATTSGGVDSHSKSSSHSSSSTASSSKSAVAAAAAAVPPELTAAINEAAQLRHHVELVAAVKVLRDAVRAHPTEYAALTMYHQVSYVIMVISAYARAIHINESIASARTCLACAAAAAL